MKAITRDPETMHGVPVFRGTRVPVQTLFDYLEGGETLEDFLTGFPTVSRDFALAALRKRKSCCSSASMRLLIDECGCGRVLLVMTDGPFRQLGPPGEWPYSWRSVSSEWLS